MANPQRGPTKTVQVRDWSAGINRTASRTAIKDSNAWWLENLQPIGQGNLQLVPPPGPSIATIAAGIATLWGIQIKIGGVEVARLISVNNDGSMSAINPSSGAVTTIAPANTVTTKARMRMWQDTPLLIVDPTKGYFSWDGTTLILYPYNFTGTIANASPTVTAIPSTTGLVVGMSVSGANIPASTTIKSVDSGTQITLSANATGNATETLTVGAGAPTTGVDLAVFEGRVWIVSALRTLTFTAPNSFTGFQTVDGAGSTGITDSAFIGSVSALLSALELLWILGPAAINAISNVQISGSTTTFSNTNIVANVGTVLPSSVASFLRTFLFLAPYGVYAIVGATPQKLSDDLDGLFPPESGSTVGRISFGADAPAAVFTLTSVFIWGVLVTYNDPVTGNRPIILCFARNAWFAVSQGSVTWITGLVDPATGKAQLWATDGSTVFRCFAGTGATAYTLQTKLWDFGAFTQRKQMLRLAMEFSNPQANQITATFTVENETGSQAQSISLQTGNTLTFTGAGGAALTFVGTGAITWITSGIQQAVGPVNFAGDELGLKVSGTSLPFVISGLAMEIGSAGEWT